MRLTRVAIDGDAVVDLHPRLTVVRGLGPDARQRLVDAFNGLPDGVTRGVTGWVELDGTRRDLGTAVFEDFTVPEDAKLVVRAGDLPGSDPSLHRVSSRRADLGYERDRLLERLESARARVREATEACGRTLREWQVVHGGLPEVGADGDAVLEPTDEAEPQAAHAEDAEPEEQVDPRHALQARIDEIDRALLPLDPVEPGTVLAALEAAAPPVAALDEPADELAEPELAEPEVAEDGRADPFSSTGEDLFVGNPFAAPFEEDPDPIVVAGRLRVAEARRALAAAQTSQRTAFNRTELIEALEAAHAEVVDAHHRDRFGRSRSKVDAARSTEQEVLEQLGFPSYTAFVLSAGAIKSGDEPEELADAQAALAAAEAELARVVAVRAAVQAGDDAASDDTSDTTSELRAALAEVGLVLEDVTTDSATLVALARSWLAEQEMALERRDALVAERAELVEELATYPDPNEVEEPLSEVAALARAEAELLGAEAEVSGVTTRLEEIAEATKALLAEEEAEGEQEPEEVQERDAMSVEQRVDDVTWYVSTRLAALRAGDDQLILPILLDDPFVDFEGDHAISLLASVEPFGGAVQIVLLTDDPALLGWTLALGSDRAWVVGAGR